MTVVTVTDIRGRAFASERVAVLAPTGRDAKLIVASLEEQGLCAFIASGIPDLCDAIRAGAGALVVAEEAFSHCGVGDLGTALDEQPPWSDLPLVVLTTSNDGPRLDRLGPLDGRGLVSLLERPTRVRTLVAAVQAALRARRKQYQVRDLLLQREQLLASEARARGQAERANELKDDFLAIVSHELRTPLNAMLGWTRLLRTGTLDAELRDRALETVERNTLAQARLVEDLLDISRIVSGKLALELARIDACEVAMRAVESMRPTFEAKQQCITLTGSPRDVCLVRGDATRLEQVFHNLLTNAAKFTEIGGSIEVGTRRNGLEVELWVKDSGRGIDVEFLPYVFDRFRQLDRATTRRHGGLGLGLSIAKNLVELQGGHIDVTSEGTGKGTMFRVCLPAIEATPRQASVFPPGKPAEPRMLELEGIDVLVIDDEPDARDLVRTVLARSGAHTREADSASGALDAIKAGRPDVVLSDIGMPGEDGYAFIQALRALPDAQGGRIPAAAVSAYSRADDRSRALALGFQMHIAKPIEPSALVEATLELARMGKSPTAKQGPHT